MQRHKSQNTKTDRRTDRQTDRETDRQKAYWFVNSQPVTDMQRILGIKHHSRFHAWALEQGEHFWHGRVGHSSCSPKIKQLQAKSKGDKLLT